MELKNFIEIEKKYHLLDEQIEGFCFWVYGRAEIQWYIRNKIYGYSDYHSWNPRFFEQFRLRIHMMANAIVRGNIKKKQYDVLVLNSARKIWNDNHYECICTESIIKEIKNTIVLEGLYEQKHFRPVETPNLVYLDRIEMQAQLSYYFAYFMRKKKYRAVYNQIYERLIQPIKELEQIYSIEIDIKTILNFIIPEFFKYKVKKKKFYKILKKTTPKLILEVASYDPNCMVE